MAKLMVGKEKIRFDVVDYFLINDTIDDEYLGCFPFGNDPLSSVIVNVL